MGFFKWLGLSLAIAGTVYLFYKFPLESMLVLGAIIIIILGKSYMQQ
jgi:hypothetical protein